MPYYNLNNDITSVHRDSERLSDDFQQFHFRNPIYNDLSNL